MADRSDAAPGSGTQLTCWDCGHELGDTAPCYSITGNCLCPGCADNLHAAICSLAALSGLNGLAGSSATAMWFGRANRHTQAHTTPA
ncbi:MAG TPA: hypothetical protein VJ831_01855 [Jatrophihabitantaceae bacterium]|nr:hypothetical protein [Jatrophihabitantaceae bacterium]